MKMNEFTDFQLAWIEALESGKFDQTWGRLCTGSAFCCLGVAIHVYDANHPALAKDGWDALHYVDDYADTIMDEGEVVWEDGATCPPDVGTKLMLENSEGKFLRGAKFEIKGETCRSLVQLNDKAKLTFPEIAAFIRKHPWAVFQNFTR